MNLLISHFIALMRKDGVKNTIILTTGVGVSQLIIFIIQLITRRLYSPEIFGVYDVYFNLLGILVVFVALRYEMAVVLPKEDDVASNIAALAIFFSFSLNLILLLAVLFFRSIISSVLNFPEKYSLWLLFLPFTTFFFSSYQVINYWLIRKKKFRSSSLNKIARRSSEGVFQVGLGFLKNSFGLISGDLAGNLVNFTIGLRQILHSGFTFKHVSVPNMKKVFYRYIQFPKYNLLPALLNTVSTALPFLIINKYYGSTVTGYFGLSKMILAIPVALISTSLSQVLLQRITEKKNSGMSIKKDVDRSALYLAGIGLAGTLILSLWGVELITFFFDKTWETSGRFIKIIVFASAINFVVSPLSIVFVTLEKLNIQAIWQGSYFLMTLGLLLFRQLPVEQFLYIYITIDIVSYLAYFILIEKVIAKYEISISRV